MFLKRLELRNFRSYEAASVDIDKNLNFIVGANGSGKTGLLEAIYFLAETRSFKKAEDQELIQLQKDFANIKIQYSDKLGDHDIEAVINKKGKTFTIDNVKKKTAVSVIGNLMAIAYDPSMVFLFKDEPAERRKMMDETLSPIDSQYLYSLGRYRKYLKERNQALALDYDPEVIKVLTTELIMSSYRIFKLRQRLIINLDKTVNEIFKKLDNSQREIHLSYKTNFPVADNQEDYITKLNKAYEEKRSEEITRKITLIGIHRDDLEASIDGLNLGSSGSQGQNRLVTIAIKLAIAQLTNKVTSSYPIMLLDDIFSDLDEEHLEKLKEELEEYPGQIFVTGCTKIKNNQKWNHLTINNQQIERSN